MLPTMWKMIELRHLGVIYRGLWRAENTRRHVQMTASCQDGQSLSLLSAVSCFPALSFVSLSNVVVENDRIE